MTRITIKGDYDLSNFGDDVLIVTTFEINKPIVGAKSIIYLPQRKPHTEYNEQLRLLDEQYIKTPFY